MEEGGCLIWESEEVRRDRHGSVSRCGPAKQISQEEDPRVHAAQGSQCAEGRPIAATLQLPHAGQRFPGRRSSPCQPLLQNFASRQEQFHEVVHKQYVKKFGRLGEAGRDVRTWK
jgi:pyruvate-ferredoxin/flavodoxin oxidoreductase